MIKRHTVALTLLGLAAASTGCLADFGDTSSAIDRGVEPVPEPGGEGQCIGEAPELPYNLDVGCGETLTAVVAAFNDKTDGEVIFAPHPDAKGHCLFLVQGAAIHAREVEECESFTVAEADALAEGSKDVGEDRITVSWCWPSDSGVQCETDHMTLRYSCEDGADEQHDSTPPTHADSCQGVTPEPEPELPVFECSADLDCDGDDVCQDGACAPAIS